MTNPIQGRVDGIEEGHFLAGWAIHDRTDTPCLVKITTQDGQEVGQGLASRVREDLADVGKGRTDFAFRIPIRFPPDAQSLDVTVEGVPLHGSPIPIGRGHFDGHFTVIDGIIQGFIAERAVDAPRPLIRVEDHFGRVVAQGLATFRPDRDDTVPGVARIHLPFLPESFGFDELALQAFANDVPFAHGSCAVRLVGSLDTISPERCTGWLLSPDAPHQQFEIELFSGDTRIGGGRCEVPRDDLKEAHPISWRAGFDLPITPPRLQGDTPMQVSIRLAGTRTALFGSPFLLGNRAPLVAAAKRAAARLRADKSFSLEERQAVQQAMAELIARRRQGPPTIHERIDAPPRAEAPAHRLNIIIPVYKDVAVTRACIESVIATRDPARDAVILVNDRSPERGMAHVLAAFTRHPGVHLLENAVNLGFVGSVNRALAFCRSGHVVLLNSDTRVFAGAWDEMERLVQANPEIGTITAMSNNATIFSYPHPSCATATALADASWEDLAAAALVVNSGQVVDVPTGHGFCMLIRREVVDRVGYFDARFGRGYGEENDLCMRTSDLGWRNVAACGVLIEHHESVSFEGAKDALLSANLTQLNTLYPDYIPTIMAYEREDPMRAARWPLDRLRLARARESGTRYALIVQNRLGGGTKAAIEDIEHAYGYDGRERITLTFRADGVRELRLANPAILAVFAPAEDEALFATLDEAGVDLVFVHQLLGATSGFIRRLARWGRPRQMKFYLHDFYALCPRVTLLNAVDRFCAVADVETCARCVKIGGAHEASQLDDLTPAEHRALFGEFMMCCSQVIAPSNDTVKWAQRVFSDIAIAAIPHPQYGMIFPDTVRDGDPDQVVLLGAIGPHKGSRRLLALAEEARLTHPSLRFHVVGYTDIDRELRAVGNVTITGPYVAAELATLVARTRARVALFLHEWPETFSYTLSEAWALGLWAVVPKLGAPSERVRARNSGSIIAQESDDLILEMLHQLTHQVFAPLPQPPPQPIIDAADPLDLPDDLAPEPSPAYSGS